MCNEWGPSLRVRDDTVRMKIYLFGCRRILNLAQMHHHLESPSKIQLHLTGLCVCAARGPSKYQQFLLVHLKDF